MAFELNGKLESRFAAHGEASFTSPMAQPVWALPRNNGGFVMAAAPVFIQANPHTRAELSFFDFSANGAIDHAFGKHGVADVQLPYLSQSFPASAVPIALATNGAVSALVTSTASGKALRLIQLPY